MESQLSSDESNLNITLLNDAYIQVHVTIEQATPGPREEPDFAPSYHVFFFGASDNFGTALSEVG